MIFEKLSSVANEIDDFQKKVIVQQNNEQQQLIDDRYRTLLVELVNLTDIAEYLICEENITKPTDMIDELKNILIEFKEAIKLDLITIEKVRNIESSFDAINNKFKSHWSDVYEDLTNSKVNTLKVVQKISPIDINTYLQKISSAKTWTLDIEKFKRLFKELDNADKLITSLNLDDNIIVFLQKINSNNATIEDLNSDVIKWIEKERLTNRIKISFSR